MTECKYPYCDCPLPEKKGTSIEDQRAAFEIDYFTGTKFVRKSTFLLHEDEYCHDEVQLAFKVWQVAKGYRK